MTRFETGSVIVLRRAGVPEYVYCAAAGLRSSSADVDSISWPLLSKRYVAPESSTRRTIPSLVVVSVPFSPVGGWNEPSERFVYV